MLRTSTRKYLPFLLSGGAVVGLAASAFALKPEKTKRDDFAPGITRIPEVELHNELPVEVQEIVHAPNVPPPITRDHPARVRVDLDTSVQSLPLSRSHKYRMWTFNGQVPGPLIRAREGDVLEVHFTNKDEDGIAHNIDFHAVTGPGGGSPVLFTEQNETKTAYFRLLYPGLYIYHCAAAPIPMHISNGMYGLVLVEPKDGLPAVDREFYVLQSEFHTEPSDEKNILDYSYVNGLEEKAQYVVFNGREGALTDNPLMAKTGERVRIFFGNAGANLSSAFHIIGTIFDKLYRDADLISPPARGVQTTLVPPGGATVVEMEMKVPGTYSIVDHAIYRIDKGAVGFLKVAGEARPDIYAGDARPETCPGCKVHE
ncbi:hypothetical protein AAVH_16102 [Aphelenchoides avenae]|nr:hypothetical protein AAVH_16102 [Aphelenchus avenae]